MSAEIQRVSINGAGALLSVVTTGPVEAKPIVLLHGMRDHGLSLLFLARYLPDFRLIAPDLRGHGHSENIGSYSMLQFVTDLHLVIDEFADGPVSLVGHSLGGHICARYASLYPGQLERLILLDGLGPPGTTAQDDTDLDAGSAEARLARWRYAMGLQCETQSQNRIMPSEEAAVERLARNNPGLDSKRVRELALSGIETVAGGYQWRWDQRVDTFWNSYSQGESEAAFRYIPVPVLLVTGEYSLDYWVSFMPEIAGQDAFYEREQSRRCALFPQASHVVLPGAGHMLHYDQPDKLGAMLRQFIEG